MDENPYESPRETGKSSTPRHPAALRTIYVGRRERAKYRVAALGISAPQFLICVVLAFGDIGFDHPGRFGLDFGHFLLLLAAQAGLFLLSLALPIAWRRWRLLLIPAVFVPLTLLAVWYGS